MGVDVVALKAAKKYVDETLTGAGALKGEKGDPGEILVILHSAFRLVLLVLSETVEALKYLCFSQMDGRRCNEWM